MANYKVQVCRITYQYLEIPVNSYSKEEAKRVTLLYVNDHDFPNEKKHIDHTVQDIFESNLTKESPCLQPL